MSDPAFNTRNSRRCDPSDAVDGPGVKGVEVKLQASRDWT
jgi:hypothetical protein